MRGPAHVLHHGAAGVPGLADDPNSARQYPLGEPFPEDRWLGKVGHRELQGLSAEGMARLLTRRMTHSTLGPALGARIVAIDEVGVEAQDDGCGPRLLQAMTILAGRRDPVTGDPLSRRWVMYIAPKMVANVGEPHDRDLWDSALAAARLSGGAYLQVYHASGGRVTGVATASEWKAYLPHWRAEMRSRPEVLRVIFTRQPGVSQDTQWAWARQTTADTRALRNGVAEYRLGSSAEAVAFLRNWNRFAR